MAVLDDIFSGLRILDVASYIAGPAAATILSGFGGEHHQNRDAAVPATVPVFLQDATEPGLRRQLRLAIDEPEQAQHWARPEIRAVQTCDIGPFDANALARRPMSRPDRRGRVGGGCPDEGALNKAHLFGQLDRKAPPMRCQTIRVGDPEPRGFRSRRIAAIDGGSEEHQP